MDRFEPIFDQALQRLDRLSRRRTLHAATPDGPDHHGRWPDAAVLDFSSNDYLGLATHPAVIDRACDYARRYGAGSAASRLIRGDRTPALEIEARIARSKGAAAALLFASGWQANAAVLPALVALLGRDTQVYADRLVHASLHQGCRSAGVREIRFHHNDLDHLEHLIRSHAGNSGHRIIVTESVFSMDGDRSDVEGLADLAERHGAFLYLDEAHATGVLGPGGMGLSGLAQGRVHLVMGTCSKALGSFGAYVAGSRALCDYLVNSCSGFMHTTALPPAALGAIDAALDLMPGMQTERDRLARHAEQLRRALHALGLGTGPSSTQIIPIMTGDERRTLDLSRCLLRQGIRIPAIRPPTVPAGASRMRVALNVHHTPAGLDRLLQALAAALEQVR